MRASNDLKLHILFVASLIAIVTGIYLAFYLAPVEGNLGIVQKIFYFHVPAAFATYLGFLLCALGSIIYLLKPRLWADRMARAGAEVGLLFGLIVLITGPLWAYKSWGHFWEWEPRLTSMLLTFLIYCSYLLLRAFGGTGDSARKIGAVMGVLGLVGVGVVRVSVKLWGGVHPQVVFEGGGLHPDMYPPFYVCIVGFLLLAWALVWMRMNLQRDHEEIEALHLLAEDLEYELETP